MMMPISLQKVFVHLKRRKEDAEQGNELISGPLRPLRMSYSDIKLTALIHLEGLGWLYQGTLNNGRRNVAVKKWNLTEGEGYELVPRLVALSQVSHPNFAPLTGVCIRKENGKPMLITVHGHAERGTLAQHLLRFSNSDLGMQQVPALSWEQRLQICSGYAEALHYLHTHPSLGFNHCNVSSLNIFVDENYTAKMANLGFSKPMSYQAFEYEGHKYYLADPEYAFSGETKKFDVYSFGVVLVEVLYGGLLRLDETVPGGGRTRIITARVIGGLLNGELEKIIDPALVGKANRVSLKIFAETAEKCLRFNGDERPTMLEVLWSLEYALELQQSGIEVE